MKKILQAAIVIGGLLSVLGSCANSNCATDCTLEHSPAKCFKCEGKCSCQENFKVEPKDAL